MQVAHIALWTNNLEQAAAFWQEHFNATVGEAYHSKRREGFISHFVTLAHGPALELMTLPGLVDKPPREDNRTGWAHIAISLGSVEAVDKMVAALEPTGALVHAARWTGDGFYEAVIADPDGNLIEITS
ncbi:VOC family protein [Enterobacteriaceae bacterium H11S18]|uniref:VOC family protein n=1 Tax=Dryocola clanedunensis TaxID=2925396 RepID=UPI0022EFEB4C|nr:VOC family protein [Dryocola clanedunensis]MCT4709392.1 VOC family protein [Dryocola clanedunensis]